MMTKGILEADDLFLNCTDMSVLERQRAHLNYNYPGFFAASSSMTDGNEIGLLWTTGFDLPVLHGETTVESDPRLSISPTSPTNVSGTFKKRKFDNVVRENKDRNEKKKMMNREEEEKSEPNNESTKSITKMKTKAKKEQNNCSNDSLNATKELQKTDYIHVRARRGQATDSHSIAERVRREKISERMKYLQDLVPGCDKITGKAGMLDETINYVQSLQRQIEFLSMKLAATSPTLDFNIDDIFLKEVVSTPMTNLPNIVMPSHEMVNFGYLQINPMQQVVTNSDPFSCFNNCQGPSMWNSGVHSSSGL